jgi:TIR domain-containing protein
MPVKIFFCYAHEDEPLLNKLKTHLRPLQRMGVIDIWHDRDISAGTKWEEEINKHLNEANMILLLVSPDFMDSDYCYGIEMQRALERDQRGEARVIPIILRPVHWQGTPIGKLQALPTNAKPVKSWPDLDDAFYDTVAGIQEAMEKIRTQSIPEVHAGGVTDLGRGLELVAIELGEIPLRSLPPVLILITDGYPTDDYSSGIHALFSKPWGRRAIRYAIGIGDDIDIGTLQTFIANPDITPLRAKDAQAIVDSIKLATLKAVQEAASPASKHPSFVSYSKFLTTMRDAKNRQYD